MKDRRHPLEHDGGQRAARHGPEAGHGLVAAARGRRRRRRKEGPFDEKRMHFFPLVCRRRFSQLTLPLPYLGLARGDDVVQAHAQARLKAQGSRRGGHFFPVVLKKEARAMRGRRRRERKRRRKSETTKKLLALENSRGFFSLLNRDAEATRAARRQLRWRRPDPHGDRSCPDKGAAGEGREHAPAGSAGEQAHCRPEQTEEEEAAQQARPRRRRTRGRGRRRGPPRRVCRGPRAQGGPLRRSRCAGRRRR